MNKYSKFLIYFLILIFIVTEISSENNILQHPNFKLIPINDCGESTAINRIIGGKIAELGQFPFMARLGFEKATDIFKIVRFTCSGSILNHKYILTAAHCFKRKTNILVVVRLGEQNTQTVNNCIDDFCLPPAQEILPEKVIQHNYHDFGMENDIALIRLIESINFNDFVKSICLPYDLSIFNEKKKIMFTVAGWGAYNPNYTNLPSDVLLYADLPLLLLSECQKVFNAVTTLGEGQMCVGGKAGYDTCKGDSGAPLFKLTRINDLKPKYYIYGIVSFGVLLCGTAPAVYTNVTYYLNWILDNIEA